MKQGSNQRRGRGRGNGGRRGNRNQTYDSNGPDVKVRGTAQQVLDKYLTLARDAQSGGDRVKAEAYLQFAEHYYRIINADQGPAEGDKRADQSDAIADQPEAKEPKEKKPASRGRRRAAPKNEATMAAEAAAANEAKQDDGDSVNDDAPAAQAEEVVAGA